MNWNGTPTDLMELCKALHESKLTGGTQTDLFNALCGLFNIDTPHDPKNLIKGIRKRKKEKFPTTQKLLKALEEWDNKQTRHTEFFRKIKDFEKEGKS